MSTPVILAIDDEPEVLNAIERDLRLHFRPHYRVLKASSGARCDGWPRAAARRRSRARSSARPHASTSWSPRSGASPTGTARSSRSRSTSVSCSRTPWRWLASRARTKSVSVELQIDPGLPRVSGFGGELNQVWMNFIDNAVDAAPVGGHVTVSAKQEGRFVAVRVTDDGPGIPDHIRPKIFDPFVTTKPPGQGTGLGLDIVQRIVRGHRAELDVSSRPGRTEFRVGLPLDSTEGDGPTSSA